MERQVRSVLSSGMLALAAVCTAFPCAAQSASGNQPSPAKPDATTEVARAQALAEAARARVASEFAKGHLTLNPDYNELQALITRQRANTIVTNLTANGGIGAELMRSDPSQNRAADQPPHSPGARIQKVYLGYPAAQVGLHAGDIILTVNGRSTAHVATDTVGEWMRGTTNTDITLTVETSVKELRPDGTTGYRQYEVILTRQTIASLQSVAPVTAPSVRFYSGDLLKPGALVKSGNKSSTRPDLSKYLRPDLSKYLPRATR